MTKHRKGIPWFKFENHLPRLYLNEKKEKTVKWLIRGITLFGIVASLITLDWFFSMPLAIFIALADVFLEKTLFYYTSLYVTSLPEFEYEPDRWLANCFLSLGPPDKESEKIVGLVFDEKDYANNLFNLFREWNHGSSDNKEHNFYLTYIIDENAYFVYIYPNFGKDSVNDMHGKVETENKLKKYGKEHLGLVAGFILCKEFSTTNGFGLGMFIDNHPEDKPFLLGAFSLDEGKNPVPITEIEPIKMYAYKSKTAHQLTDEDFEYVHWNSIVDRSSLGDNA